jgi:hypothetical protein
MPSGRSGWDDGEEYEEERPRRVPRHVRRRVGAPAVGLLITAVLGFVSDGACAVHLPRLTQKGQPTTRPAGMDEETYQAYRRGQAAAPLVNMCLFSIPALGVYPLLFFGSLRMQQLRGYGLAVTSAILALLPCSPTCFVGFFVGAWALVVLLDPEVREAFSG